MDNVLIIGAGAAGSVVAKKCAMNRDVFKKIHLASRRLESCKKVQAAAKTPIDISQVDADNVGETVALIKKVKPDLVINVALPYQDLPIMDACLEAGVHYLDTANYEPRDEAKFDYKWQWAYHDKYKAGPDGGARLRLRSRRHQRLLRLRAEAPASTRSTPSTSSTATPAATARRSPPTSIPRSTCARSRSAASTGRTASGSRSIR